MARRTWKHTLDQGDDRESGRDEPGLGLEAWTIIRLSLIGLLLALGILGSLLWT